MKQTKNTLYNSEQQRQHLVLGSFLSDISYLLCFNDKEKKEVTLETLKELTLNTENESDVPWRSTPTETFEYELFLENYR